MGDSNWKLGSVIPDGTREKHVYWQLAAATAESENNQSFQFEVGSMHSFSTSK